MSDWDASSDEETSKKVTAPAPVVAAAIGRRRFEDEDAEDEIKDDWEEEDEEKPAPVAAAPAKKKGTVKQKIAEKEAAERRKQELGLDSDEEEEEEEDPAEKRRLQKEAQLKADIENARNLLGVSKVDDGEPLSNLTNANPSTKEDWEKLSKDMYEQLLKQYASRAGFDRYFAPHLILQLSQSMRDVDMRLSGNKLKDLAEKKARAEKEAKKAGGAIKKPKPSNVSTASAKDKIDLGAYGDEALDDDLDFM